MHVTVSCVPTRVDDRRNVVVSAVFASTSSIQDPCRCLRSNRAWLLLSSLAGTMGFGLVPFGYDLEGPTVARGLPCGSHPATTRLPPPLRRHDEVVRNTVDYG